VCVCLPLIVQWWCLQVKAATLMNPVPSPPLSSPSSSPVPSPIPQPSPSTSVSPPSSPAPAAAPLPSTNLTLSSGSAHTCALQGNNLTCWGQYANQVPAGKSWTALSAFGTPGAVCGIEAGRKVTCWGSYDPPGLNLALGGPLPADGPYYTFISASQSGSCAIQAVTGTMTCKGQLGYPADVPTTAAWASVSLSYTFGCGLLRSGEVKCWKGNITTGYNPEYGQTAVPTNVGPWVAVSAGYQHACGILANSTMLCWGWGYSGPLSVPGGTTSKWVAVSAGTMFTCGIQPGGALLCWGETSASSPSGATIVPTDVTSWSAVSAGGSQTCGITAAPVAGQVRCWGCKVNPFGQCTVPAGLSAMP
jgi:hypothetical protein